MNTFLFKKHVKRYRAFIRALFGMTLVPAGGGMRILMYHSVGGSPHDHPLATRIPVERFKEQMEKLARLGLKACTVSELIERHLPSGEGRYIALTFDDGYKDNVLNAAQILGAFGFKATFFVTTSCADGATGKTWADGKPREYMNWDDIGTLSAMGFEIGSHMVHHVDLMALGDEALRSELGESREAISKHIGKSVELASYPYGRIDERVIRMMKEAGYRGGCSSVPGTNYPSTDRYILRRTEIDGYDIIKHFRGKLDGLYD